MNIKSEILSTKSQTNPNDKSSKKYDLEERTLCFTEKVHDYVNALPKTVTNIEIGRQLARSSGSVGANYIEADGALGKRDFLMHLRIARKEAKESKYWLRLSKPKQQRQQVKDDLIQESIELMSILSVIVQRSR